MAAFTKSTPKVDWAVDVVSSTHMNNIGENISLLQQGGGNNSSLNAAVGTGTAGDRTLTFPNSTENCYSLDVNSIVDVETIDSTDRKPGCVIYLFASGSSLGTIRWRNGGTASGVYKPLLVPVGANGYKSLTPSGIILLYNGSYWTVCSTIEYYS